MSTRTHLAIVPAPEENAAARAQRLMAEAREAALEHIASFEEIMKALIQVSSEVADGGSVYPAGVRDLCRRIAEDLEAKGQTFESIMSKAG
jgi:hypothetical protein